MIEIGDVLRIRHYETCPNQWRVYLVVGCCLGGEGQEGTYELRSCDLTENECIHVPCIMLETHAGVFAYRQDKWVSLQVLRARHKSN